jgi:hypothetical protein
MSSNRFKNSGLNTRSDSPRILSRIASYDPWSAIAPKPAPFVRLISSVAHVGGHDDNRVPEIDLLAKATLEISPQSLKLTTHRKAQQFVSASIANNAVLQMCWL